MNGYHRSYLKYFNSFKFARLLHSSFDKIRLQFYLIFYDIHELKSGNLSLQINYKDYRFFTSIAINIFRDMVSILLKHLYTCTKFCSSDERLRASSFVYVRVFSDSSVLSVHCDTDRQSITVQQLTLECSILQCVVGRCEWRCPAVRRGVPDLRMLCCAHNNLLLNSSREYCFVLLSESKQILQITIYSGTLMAEVLEVI